ncbi:MAG: peptidyl-prolyl cis-trans isomerase [Acidobacteriota bacterium]|jgi:peptidyl-prolyl cis-trans isomerase SurA|nr:peptidyl-prolyl cis-trans isomerase [Acidobacteriota bacterium]NLT33041.1 hypothetical protein [Acidobacteriota bacterium]
MKKISTILPLLLLGLPLAQAGTVDRIIAKVNEEIITLSELNRHMEPARRELGAKYSGEQLQKALEKAEQGTLDALIEEKLVYQKAVELEYEADADSKIDAYIQRVMKENNLKDTDEFEEALAREGQSLREYRDLLRRQIITSELVNDFINSRISLLTPEIEQYYKNHLADFTSPEEITLSEILITPDDGDEAAATRAGEIHRRLLAGESFAALASQYSKGPTADKGGSIGSYLGANLHPDTARAVAGLGEGGISKPQRLEEGYAIFRVDARREPVARPLEEVKEEIKNRLYQEKRNPEYDRFITQLREEAYIQIFPEME